MYALLFQKLDPNMSILEQKKMSEILKTPLM